MTARILLGQITGAHGIRGDVVIRTFTAEPDGIADYGPLIDQHGRSHTIKSVRVTPKAVIARLDGVTDRNAAEALRGTELHVDRDRLPAPEEGEFYIEDLVGLAAVSPDGARLGEVISVQNFGAGDLLELRLPNKRQTELVPFTDAFVPEVDIAGGRVVVRLPTFAPDDKPDGEAEAS